MLQRLVGRDPERCVKLESEASSDFEVREGEVLEQREHVTSVEESHSSNETEDRKTHFLIQNDQRIAAVWTPQEERSQGVLTVPAHGVSAAREESLAEDKFLVECGRETDPRRRRKHDPPTDQ